MKTDVLDQGATEAMTLTTRIAEPDRASIVYDDGARESAGFFTSGEARLFGVLHEPPEAVGGVVICSPMYAELIRNYRREILLARQLAEQGIAVQRFHPRGVGNSHGQPSEITFETLHEDTLSAAEELRARTSVPRIAFLGTRWGAVIATAAAARFGDAPLALWEPTVDAARYLREIFRGKSVSDLKNAARGGLTADDPIHELDEKGAVDILGYAFHRRLYDSILAHPLMDEFGSQPRSVLVAQLGDGRGVGRDASRLVERLTLIGCEIETEAIAGREAWWFGGELVQRDEERVWGAALVERTTEWMIRQFRRGGGR